MQISCNFHEHHLTQLFVSLPNRMYLWFDEKGKKTRVAAPQYIDYVMTFTQKTVSDESIFPTKYANEFPSSFESIARKILRLLFHVIAHLYAAHFREIALLGLHSHLNLTFAHLTALHKYVLYLFQYEILCSIMKSECTTFHKYFSVMHLCFVLFSFVLSPGVSI